MEFILYILECTDGTFYIRHTDNSDPLLFDTIGRNPVVANTVLLYSVNGNSLVRDPVLGNSVFAHTVFAH